MSTKLKFDPYITEKLRQKVAPRIRLTRSELSMLTRMRSRMGMSWNIAEKFDEDS